MTTVGGSNPTRKHSPMGAGGAAAGALPAPPRRAGAAAFAAKTIPKTLVFFGLKLACAAGQDSPFLPDGFRDYASLMAHALYTTSTRNLDSQAHLFATALHGKLKIPVGEFLEFRADGRLGLSNADAAHTGMSRLLEAYTSARAERWMLKLGKQIYAWGRADSVNPTDNLSPRDYTTLLPFADDEHIGVPAARFAYYWQEGYSLSLYSTPWFLPTHVPLALPGGGRPGERKPPVDLANVTWAVKLDKTGGAFDWSASFFQGHSLLPVLVPQLALGGGPALVKTYPQMRAFGMDAVYPFGPNGLRMEFAYGEPFGRTPPGQAFAPFLFAVFGYERALPAAANVNVQFIYRRSLGHGFLRTASGDDGLDKLARQNAITFGQLHPDNFGFSARVSKKWLNDTLDTEAMVVGYFNPDNFYFRLRGTYAFSDSLGVAVGVERYLGSQESFFGRVKDNNRFYLEWNYAL